MAQNFSTQTLRLSRQIITASGTNDIFVNGLLFGVNHFDSGLAALSGQILLADINSLSGFTTSISGWDANTYATISNLTLSGVAIELQINSLSGFSTGQSGFNSSTYATINNLFLSGSNLYGNLVSLSGFTTSASGFLQNEINTLTSNLTSTGVTIEGQLAALSGFTTGISGNSSNVYATVVNLTQTGVSIENQLASLSGFTTGQSGFSSNTYATIANLTSTGITIENQINALSGSLGTLSGFDAATYATQANLSLTGNRLFADVSGLSGVFNNNIVNLNSTDNSYLYFPGVSGFTLPNLIGPAGLGTGSFSVFVDVCPLSTSEIGILTLGGFSCFLIGSTQSFEINTNWGTFSLGSPNIGTGNWGSLGYVKSTANQTGTFYLNGIRFSAIADTGSYVGNFCNLGSNIINSFVPFNGYMKNMIFYSGVELSPTQVKNLMLYGADPLTPATVDYTAGVVSGNTLYDRSPNGFHANYTTQATGILFNYAVNRNSNNNSVNLSGQLNNLSGFTTGISGALQVLISVGGVSVAQLNSLSGFTTGISGYDSATYATIANLTSTGVIIENQINSLSGFSAPGSANYIYQTGANQTISGNLNITGVVSGSEFIIGTPGYSVSPNTAVGQITSNVSNYQQWILQNQNTGAQASSDFVVSNNFGSDSGYYADFGINSTNFTGSGTTTNIPSGAYLYNQSGDLSLGTLSPGTVHVFANNFDNLQITSGTVNTSGTYTISGQSLMGLVYSSDSNLSGSITGLSGKINNLSGFTTGISGAIQSNINILSGWANTRIDSVVFNTASLSPVMPLATSFLNNSQVYATFFDLTLYTGARLVVNVIQTGTNTGIIYLGFTQNYTISSASWTGLNSDGVTTRMNLANTIMNSGFHNIATAARGPVYIAVFTSSGNGVILPQLGHVRADFM